MSIFVSQKNPGLAEGIGQGFGAIAQALGQRFADSRQRNQFANIQQQIGESGFDNTTLGKVLAQPGGLEFLQQVGPYILPQLKQQAAQQGLQQRYPNAFGTQEDDPQLSPIQEARNQNVRTTNTGIKITPRMEQESSDLGGSEITGTPGQASGNEIGYKEDRTQSMFQQPGVVQDAINPRFENQGEGRADYGREPQGFDASRLSASQLVQLAGEQDPGLRNMALAEQKRRSEDRKIDAAKLKPYEEKISKYRDSVREQEAAVIRIEDALSGNDLKGLQNFAADYFKNDYLKTDSAAALQSATKEFLLGDIARIAGRPNQFIEQQLSAAYPKAGYSKAANQKIVEGLKTGLDIRRKELEISDDIAEKFESRGNRIPGNFERLVNKQLEPFVQQRTKELIKKYSDINAKFRDDNTGLKKTANQDEVAVVSPTGERGYIKKSQLSDAKRQGWLVL